MRKIIKFLTFFVITITLITCAFLIVTAVMDENVSVGWKCFVYAFEFVCCCAIGVLVTKRIDDGIKVEEEDAEKAKRLFDLQMAELKRQCDCNEKRLMDLQMKMNEWSLQVLEEINKGDKK